MLFEILDALSRGVKLRCPCCGHGQLFKTKLRTHDRCSVCDEHFEREPGQWFGAIYVNLFLSVMLAATGYLATNTFFFLTESQQFSAWIAVAALGPFLFFRLAKGLWTSIIFLGEGLYIRWPNR